jgi:selenocysteine lyase/cysteine desulfurase
MLSVVRSTPAGGALHHLRAREFSYLDAHRACYLDYAGAALPAQSQLAAQHALQAGHIFGNPHSLHRASRLSTDAIEIARARVLEFLDADPSEYSVCFTANTSAAIKLVAESFPFGSTSTLVLSQDNHNSVNGIREYASRRRARIMAVPLDRELRLARPRAVLASRRQRGSSLFALPAQSNFSGVKHPLSLIAEAQRLGYRVLLDAAAFVPANAISLRELSPDFLTLSIYKLFGFPAGVGALVARREALAELERPWFAGGTVEWVSTIHRAHRLRDGVEGFEDGTPNFSGIAALGPAFDFIESIGIDAINAHVADLTTVALQLLRSRRHANGKSAFRVHGPANMIRRGGTIAFDVLNSSGALVEYEEVERFAAANDVAIRGGCFCNPGASEAAFGFASANLERCLESSRVGPFTPRRLGDCLGRNVPVGALRISVGLANTVADIERGVELIAAAVGA